MPAVADWIAQYLTSSQINSNLLFSGAQLLMENRRDEKGCYIFNNRNDTENALTKETRENPWSFGIMFL